MRQVATRERKVYIAFGTILKTDALRKKFPVFPYNNTDDEEKDAQSDTIDEVGSFTDLSHGKLDAHCN